MFEQSLAYFCGPALAGIKPANLVSLSQEDYPDLSVKLSHFNRTLSPVGIQAQILCACEKRSLVLVFRPEILTSYLDKPEIRQFLARYGYADVPLDRKIARLKRRMTAKEFPHEIGAFLGYPLEDIEGFIRYRGKNFRLCGEWKVYGDCEKAAALFARYKRCRKALVAKVSQGKRLAQIFCAA